MTFPDVTALLVAWLGTQRPGPVVVDVPSPRPEAFTQIRRIGGPAAPPVRDRPSIDVICWDRSAALAMAELSTVRALVWSLSGGTTIGVTVYDVAEIMGPRHDNDPAAGQPKALMTFSLATRSDSAINQFG